MNRILLIALVFSSIAFGQKATTNAPRIDSIEGQAATAVGMLGESMSPLTTLPKITAPYTSVQNRAKMTDFSNDLLPKFGTDRIVTQSLIIVQGESGPNGETVYKPVNDIHDQLRFIGNWLPGSGWPFPYDTYGSYLQTPNTAGHSVEISFYGTGMNVLIILPAAASWLYSVDNGSDVAMGPTGQNALGQRNYSENNVIPVVSGLPTGLHTVRIKGTSPSYQMTFSGFEIINQLSINATATSGSNTLTSLSLGGYGSPSFNPITAGLASGQAITGTYIPSGTTISSVTATTIVMSNLATGSGSNPTVATLPNYINLPTGNSYSGSAKLTRSTFGVATYNTNWVNQYQNGSLTVSPSDITRGGHVLMYQKSDGTVGKDITWTNTASAVWPNATHTNEEILRTHFWREWGAGRSTSYPDATGADFSTLTTSPRASSFTLDDNTTSLSGDSVLYETTGSTDGVRAVSNGSYVQLVFIGTGLDIVTRDTATGGADTFAFSVDGGSPVTYHTTGVMNSITTKIVSGLPYGSHLIKFSRTSVSSVYHVVHSQFIVYGPKTPTLPSGAVALSDYFLVANYNASTGAANAGGPFSTGVLSRSTVREAVYTGANWTAGQNAVFPHGSYVSSTSTSADADAASFSLWGTGIELYLSYNATAPTSTLTVDTVSSCTGVVVTNGGSCTGGIITIAGSLGSQVQITGLALGQHVVKLSKHGTGDQLAYATVNVITPIHSPRNNGPFIIQNTLAVGSQGIRDLRQFGAQTVLPLKMVAQTIGVNPNATVTSTSLIPFQDMETTVKTYGNPIEISYSTNFIFTGVSGYWECDVQAYIDGFAQGTLRQSAFGFSSSQMPYFAVSDILVVPVSAGYHTVLLYWDSASASSSCLGRGNYRDLKVREL